MEANDLVWVIEGSLLKVEVTLQKHQNFSKILN